MADGYAALTEKEKQTLRLIVRGHDAKSIARRVGLSVHTVNERLRDARRKLAVSSSREAARLLFEHEETIPHSSGHKHLGEAREAQVVDVMTAPIVGRGRGHRAALIGIGATTMLFALALVAITTLPQLGSPPAGASASAADGSVTETTEVEATARRWLALLDAGRWTDSYNATGASFRQLNTSEVWANVSERVRTPLGAPISRAFLSEENLPAPPHGYQVVKFRTRFANKPDAVETVTLDREEGAWRVVGVTIG